MNVLFVIHGLSEAGGAEKQISIIANYFNNIGENVTFLLFESSTNAPFFPLKSTIERIYLALKRGPGTLPKTLLQNIRGIYQIRGCIKAVNPDLVVSFLTETNIRVLISSWGLKIPVIISERNHPAYKKVGRAWSFLRKMLYQKADAIVVQTQAIKAFFSPGIQRKISIIPNPVPEPEKINDQTLIGSQKPFLLAMGSLHPQKGFDDLIRAFALISKQFPNWILIIVGEGDERSNLEKLIKQHELTNTVFLPGKTSTPYQYYNHADIFILSSRYEGFPNVLCEAMSCGKAVIATDCPSGPSEIIEDGVDGVIVPVNDVQKLSETLSHIMSDSSLRKKLGDNARQITAKFDLSNIMGRWIKLGNELTSHA